VDGEARHRRARRDRAPRGESDVDLRELVVEYRVELFRYARAFTRNDADAEDLAQTAVVRALGPNVALTDPEKAKAYLLRIVRNLATDQARARARVSVEPWATVPDAPSGDPDLDEDMIRDVDRAVPRAAFAGLPEPHREILVLRFLEELDYGALAARLHTTEHAARQRVYRAMQALRATVRREQQRRLGVHGTP
jgi:RNA polymerase sigma-70 factor (ECF subfamily)